MSIRKPHKGPGYLQCVNALKFGELFAHDIYEELLSTGPHRFNIGSFEPDELLIIGEFLAASIGHPCSSRFWNIYLEEALFHTGFVASLEFTRGFLERLKPLTKLESLNSSWRPNLEDLIRRLGEKPVARPRPNPLLTKQAAKKILRDLRPEQKDSLAISGSDLICSEPTAHEALLISSLRSQAISRMTIFFDTDPTDDNIEAIRILLYRFRGALINLNISAWMLTTERFCISASTLNFWHDVIGEIQGIEKLTHFHSYNLGVDTDLATAILGRHQLVVFRAESGPACAGAVQIGKKAVESILNSPSLSVFAASRCAFRAPELKRIFDSQPNLILIIDNKPIEKNA